MLGIFSSPRLRLVIWSRKKGSVVPSHVSSLSLSAPRLKLVFTYVVTPAIRDGVHLHRKPPSGHPQVYEATQLGADDFTAKSFPAQGQKVVLELAWVTDTAYSWNPLDQQNIAHLPFSAPVIEDRALPSSAPSSKSTLLIDTYILGIPRVVEGILLLGPCLCYYSNSSRALH